MKYPEKIGIFERKKYLYKSAEYILQERHLGKIDFYFEIHIYKSEEKEGFAIVPWGNVDIVKHFLTRTFQTEKECIEEIQKWSDHIYEKYKMRAMLKGEQNV